MLKLLNGSRAMVALLTQIKDYSIESDLTTDDKLINFKLPKTVLPRPFLQQEYFLQSATDEYVIKEINFSDEDFYEIYGKLNVDSLRGKAYLTYETESVTIGTVLTEITTGTGWNYQLVDANTKLRTLRLTNVSVYQIILECCVVYGCEVWFDTLNHVARFYTRRGQDRGAYVYSELNLRDRDYQSDTYDLVTRLYPYGKDGLSIASVNAGLEYIDNTQFTSKIVERKWVDDRYTNAQALYEDAVSVLDVLSKPRVSFRVDVLNLAASRPEYTILDFQLGDTVRIFDKTNQFIDTQRIVRLVEYPLTPEKNKADFSNSPVKYSGNSSKQIADLGQILTSTKAELNEAIDQVTALVMNGESGNVVMRYNEVNQPYEILIMDTADISTATRVWRWNMSGLSYSATGYNGPYTTAITMDGQIVANFITTGTLSADRIAAHSLTADKLAVGTITAESGIIADLAITTAKIAVGAITTALIETGAVETAQIADGSITDAKIVGLTANKITAGTLDAGQIDVVNLNAANITVGTINGQQITGGAIDWSKLASNVVTPINTANTNASQAIADASAAAIAAGNAQTTADGKNTVYYQDAQPPTTSRKLGDVWFDTNDSNRMYRWNSTAWEAEQFGVNAIADLSITNAKIVDAAIQSAKIASLDAGKITTGTLDAARISAGAITTSHMAASAVTVDKLAANSVTAVKIAVTTITGDKLVASTITGDKIAAATITANNLVAGTITAASGVIADAAITNAKIADATIQSAKIASLDAGKVTTGTLQSSTGNSWISLANGQFSFGNGALAWNGTSLTARGSFEATSGTLSAKLDAGSIRLLNSGVELGYLSIQTAGPTGPWLTAAAGASTINLAKVVGSSLYTAYKIDWGSTGGTSATHNFWGTANYYGNIVLGPTIRLIKNVDAGYTDHIVEGLIGANDYYRITAGGENNNGFLELATADDGTEPIFVRQYTGYFNSLVRTATLLDGSGNTAFPGRFTANDILDAWNVGQSYTAIFDNNNGGFSQVTIRPNGDSVGNLGSASYTWSYAAITTVNNGSARRRKEKIQLFDEQSAYDQLKDIPIYSFAYKHEEFEDHQIGTMIEYMPVDLLDTARPPNNTSGQVEHWSMGSGIWFGLAVSKVLQQKLEMLEQRIEELEATREEVII